MAQQQQIQTQQPIQPQLQPQVQPTQNQAINQQPTIQNQPANPQANLVTNPQAFAQNIANQAQNTNNQPNPVEQAQNPQTQTENKETEAPLTEEEQEEKNKAIKQEAIKKIKAEAEIDFFVEMYDKMSKGSEDDFKDTGWITNKFYEGSYLDGYLFTFEQFGVTMKYNLTEYYEQDKKKIIEKMVELKTAEPASFEMTPSAETTFDIIQFLNQFVVESIFEFQFDTEIFIGNSFEGDVPSAEEKCEKAMKEKAEARKKKEAEKANEKKETASKEGDEGGEGTDEEKPKEGEGEAGDDKKEEPAEGEAEATEEETPAEEERLLRRTSHTHKNKHKKSRKRSRNLIYF